MIRVAINGFGRIGRVAFRQMITTSDFDIVAINSLNAEPDSIAYLIKYDSVHGSFHEDEISYDEKDLIIAGKKRIKLFSESDPVNLPWKELNIDLVLECSGAFTSVEGASKHIEAGAKKVLISAPGKDAMPTIVYGVNDNILNGSEKVVSSASCTTNCLAPVLNVINSELGIEKGFMTTVHAYTSDQNVLDNSHKKGILARRGRAASENIVPASTGAAKTISLIVPGLEGKMDGIAFRVPESDGSVVDLTVETQKTVTKEEVNNILEKHQNDVLKVTKDPIVSSDVIGKKYGSIVDSLLTNVINCNGKSLVKIVAWYDNEYGYTAQMLRVAKAMFK